MKPNFKDINIKSSQRADIPSKEWEKANKIDPQNPDDRNGDADKDGYTNLEEYLNSLCAGIH